GTEMDRYQTGVQNQLGQYETSRENAQLANELGLTQWRVGPEVAMQEFLRNQGRLEAAQSAMAGLGGEAGISTLSSQLGVLPVEQQIVDIQPLQLQLLMSLLKYPLSGARNENQVRRAVHTQMERIAGRKIPRPPSNIRKDINSL